MFLVSNYYEQKASACVPFITNEVENDDKAKLKNKKQNQTNLSQPFSPHIKTNDCKYWQTINALILDTGAQHKEKKKIKIKT